MTFVCQYAVARFLPYVETGEFANFGIVLSCPETGYFGFRLLTKAIGRITAFFDELDPVIYRRTCKTLQAELERIRDHGNYAALGKVTAGNGLFAELIRPRETILRFSDMRVLMTNDPAAEVEKLFKHYVERSFVTAEYKDKIADKAVRRILTEAGVQQSFIRDSIQAGGYHATFPFVRRQDDRILQVIKPLHLAYDDGTKIYDHGWQWVGRIHRLRELQLRPDQILVPVKGPDEDGSERFEQFIAARRELQNVGAKVVPIEDQSAIRDFVSNGIVGPPESVSRFQ